MGYLPSPILDLDSNIKRLLQMGKLRPGTGLQPSMQSLKPGKEPTTRMGSSLGSHLILQPCSTGMALLCVSLPDLGRGSPCR